MSLRYIQHGATASLLLSRFLVPAYSHCRWKGAKVSNVSTKTQSMVSLGSGM
jgi:hypothetical protein